MSLFLPLKNSSILKFVKIFVEQFQFIILSSEQKNIVNYNSIIRLVDLRCPFLFCLKNPY